MTIGQRCKNCFRWDHTLVKCPSQYGCKRCGGRHNVMICPQLPWNKGGGPPKKEDREKPKGQETVSEVAPSVQQYASGHATLLATAPVKVESANRNATMVRALFDTGSQRTYMTEAALRSLKITKLRQAGKSTYPSALSARLSMHTAVHRLRRFLWSAATEPARNWR